MPTLCAVENPHVTYSWPSVHMWSLCIRGSTSKDSADHGLCGTVVFIVEKKFAYTWTCAVPISVVGSENRSLKRYMYSYIHCNFIHNS